MNGVDHLIDPQSGRMHGIRERESDTGVRPMPPSPGNPIAPTDITANMGDPFPTSPTNVIANGSRTDVGSHRPRADIRTRSNAQWTRPLRGADGPTKDTAVRELRSYLRSALAKAFAAEPRVQDADLDDFTHDAILKIMLKLDSFRGESRFTTWATSIALRVAFTELRGRRHAHVGLEDIQREAVATTWNASHASRDPDRRIERDELLAALQSAINSQLTERQRVVIQCELQGVASDRLAELLGTNRNALYKVYHDARKKLRRVLSEAGFTPEIVRDLLEETT